ncbi:MAG: radical SAM protein [Armatimonadota bacterium]|nr:radical SAM protein [bacterium]
MAVQSEVCAKSVLTKSGISDYAVNCYYGCLHNCVYCYARYMRKFNNHTEPWGQYLDAKINAPEVLAREVTRKAPGKIFFSSACDAWQPAERKYELTRQCLKIAIDAGFSISALTKSSLVTRDFDILSASPNVSLGCTITTVNESIRRKIEPAASSSESRIQTLTRARKMGIATWAFCGPLMPGLTDTPENIEQLFAALSTLELDQILIDKLNFRSGVFESVMDLLQRFYPALTPMYRSLYQNQQEYDAYADRLVVVVTEAARAAGISSKLQLICR